MCASLHLWTAPAPAAPLLPACCCFIVKALSPFRSPPALVPLLGCLLCFLWLELKAVSPSTTDLVQTFEVSGNPFFHCLRKLFYYLLCPACHPSRELEVVSGFLPSESTVNADWLGGPLSSGVFGLPNFHMTSFFRTRVSSSKEM